MDCALGVMSEFFLSSPRSWRYSLLFFLKDLAILHLTLGCMVHFEAVPTFLYKVWYLGPVSIISQEYAIVPTSFAHKTVLTPLIVFALCQKNKPSLLV